MTVWSYLTRSTGIVASVLAVGSIVWGVRFSARATGNRLRPNWWLDLHNWLGGLALGFTLAHVIVALIDSDSGIGLLDAVLPGHANDSTGRLLWGLLAMYGFALVVFTSWPKKRFGRRTWRALHLVSLPSIVLVGLHAFLFGSDAGSNALRFATLASVAVMVYPLVLRILGLKRR